MIPGYALLSRKARSLGGKVIRRARLLPGGVPDRLGDDAQWQHRSFEGDIVVFFPDTIGGLYQLQTWYGPLKRLHTERGVTIVCMDSRTGAAIRKQIDIPVLVISQESFLDEVMQRSNIKLFLYVNFTQANFLALRIRSVIHVALTHGDSDKSVSVSNQNKAFDYTLVAGQAAIDRFEKYTPLFDAQARCIAIGRPQNDTDEQFTYTAGEPPTIMYAPTWEGGHETVSYGSVYSHGHVMVQSLIKAGYRVIYRPHPLIGQRLATHGEADGAIRRLIATSAGSRVSTGRPIAQDFAQADLLITDVSSVANDWLVTGRPLLITSTAVPHTKEAATAILQVAPRITVDQAPQVPEVVAEHLSADPTGQARGELTEYYLSDTRPGASIARFLEVCQELSELRDQEWARISANEEHAH